MDSPATPGSTCASQVLPTEHEVPISDAMRAAAAAAAAAAGPVAELGVGLPAGGACELSLGPAVKNEGGVALDLLELSLMIPTVTSGDLLDDGVLDALFESMQDDDLP